MSAENLAEELAGQGREELVRRFRDAYTKAAALHGDLVAVDSERIEVLIQRAVEDADGLQWRRALAGLASQQLGIGLGDALTHPAVVRAHQIVGAPSYETALAKLAAPVPAPVVRPGAAPEAPAAAPVDEAEAAAEPVVEPEPVAEPEAVAVMPGPVEVPDPEPQAYAEAAPEPAHEPEPASEPEPAATPAAEPDPEPLAIPDPEPLAPEHEPEPEPPAEPQPAPGVHPEPGDEPDEFEDDYTYEHPALNDTELAHDDVAEFEAVHISGVATLASGHPILVNLSAEGLDLHEEDGIVGRLGWADISALEVTVPHGRRRRKGPPRLVVHTAGGSARFEVPGLSGEDLQARVQPVMQRYAH